MANSRNKYLIKNTAIFAIGNMSTKMISFFLVPIYTYILSTEDYGTIDLVFTMCSIVTPVIMCNIGEAIKRYSLDKNADDYGILTTAFIWIGIGIILSAVIAPVMGIYPKIHNYVMQMFMYILIYSSNVVFTEYLRGREKFISYTVCSVFTTLLIAVLNILFLVVMKLGIEGYFMAYIIAYFCSAVLAIVLGTPFRVFGHWKFDMHLFTEMSKFSVMLVPNALLWWIINSSDRIMVSSMIGVHANGLFAVAYKIPSLMTTLSAIVMQAWQYSAIKERQSEDKIEYNNKMFGAYIRLSVMLAAILITIVKPMLKIYVAPDYYEAWKYSPFLIIGFLFLTLATFVGTSYFVEKDMKGNLVSALIGAVINVFLNLILISSVGIIGATIASCISYICIFAFRMKDTCKYLPLYFRKKEYLINFIILFSILITCYIPFSWHYLILIVENFALILYNRKFIYGLFLPAVNRIRKDN